MPGPDGIILGFDPGGKNAFGWSVCVAKDGCLEKRLKAGIADDALSARDAVKNYLDGNTAPKGLQVLAAGIDAPMFWSEKGDRIADGYLRDALACTNFKGSRGGTVQAVNSLRGAAVVQGVLLGKHLMECWDTILITESHPRVVLHLLNYNEKRSMIVRLIGNLHDWKRYGDRCPCGCQEAPEPPLGRRLSDAEKAEQKREDRKAHMRDATLAAISAWAMVHKPCEWHNLYELERQEQDGQPIQPFNTPVAYWMPKPATSEG